MANSASFYFWKLASSHKVLARNFAWIASSISLTGRRHGNAPESGVSLHAPRESVRDPALRILLSSTDYVGALSGTYTPSKLSPACHAISPSPLPRFDLVACGEVLDFWTKFKVGLEFLYRISEITYPIFVMDSDDDDLQVGEDVVEFSPVSVYTFLWQLDFIFLRKELANLSALNFFQTNQQLFKKHFFKTLAFLLLVTNVICIAYLISANPVTPVVEEFCIPQPVQVPLAPYRSCAGTVQDRSFCCLVVLFDLSNCCSDAIIWLLGRSRTRIPNRIPWIPSIPQNIQ